MKPMVDLETSVVSYLAGRTSRDLARICLDLKRIERKCRHRIVRGTPRPVLARTGTSRRTGKEIETT